MNRRKIISGIVLAALLIVLIIVRKPLMRLVLPVAEDIHVSEIVLDNDSAFIVISLTVRNKGVFEIELQNVSLNVYDDTVLLASHKSDTVRILKRSDTKEEQLFCRISLRSVVDRIQEHQGEDSVRLIVNGMLKVKSVLGEEEIPVRQTIPVVVPVPPKLYVRQIDYLGKDEVGFNLQFHLTLINYNSKELRMNSITYEFHSDNELNLVGSLDSINIKSSDSTQLVIPAHLKIGERLQLIRDVIMDEDQMNYSFGMKGNIASFTDLVDRDVPLSVTVSGRMELFNEELRQKPKLIWHRKKN